MTEKNLTPEQIKDLQLIASELGVSYESLLETPEQLKDNKELICECIEPTTLEELMLTLSGEMNEGCGCGCKKSDCQCDTITSIEEIAPGMLLMGTVTNTTKFGAFVNIGIKETGLVHISEIANQFVVDPADFVQVGQEIKVLVTDVDAERGRISLSIKRVE